MEDKTVRIPILEDNIESYRFWANAIKAALRAIDAERFIIAKMDRANAEKDAVSRTAFHKAYAYISSTVSKPLFTLVESNEDPESVNPYIVWKRLEDRFNPKSLSNRHQKKIEFWTLEMSDDETIEMFIARIDQLAATVNSIVKSLAMHTEAKLANAKKLPDIGDIKSATFDAMKDADTMDWMATAIEVFLPKLFANGKKFASIASFITDDNKLSVLIEGIKSRFPIIHANVVQNDRMTYEDVARYASQFNTPEPIRNGQPSSLNFATSASSSSAPTLKQKKKKQCTFCNRE